MPFAVVKPLPARFARTSGPCGFGINRHGNMPPVRLGAARRSFSVTGLPGLAGCSGFGTRGAFLNFHACGSFRLTYSSDRLGSLIREALIGWRGLRQWWWSLLLLLPWCFSMVTMPIPLLSNTVLVVSIIWLPEPPSGGCCCNLPYNWLLNRNWMGVPARPWCHYVRTSPSQRVKP